MKSISAKIFILALGIIMILASVGIAVSASGLKRMSGRLSETSLTMKVRGDMESLIMAFQYEYGTARLESGRLVDEGGIPLTTPPS